MSTVSKHIVKSYSNLFDGLDAVTKLELIESLTKSIRKNKDTKETAFYKSFGAFSASEEAETLVDEIRSARKFRKKDISF
ncbi:hypothetical protein [Olivibacter domesticus]|uniref:Uncharacterized protein n=1 Tax=Olivibacter domesticus TaxID=407022 RepID=A0A1H7H298_OLID1|nr:hypothetical protein [Olivibacter domesticus]SEK42255.1 hypothetical protein SAMN05661044_00207 [Olivibacter domesticus]